MFASTDKLGLIKCNEETYSKICSLDNKFVDFIKYNDIFVSEVYLNELQSEIKPLQDKIHR